MQIYPYFSFDPTHNQAEYGTPRNSAYGAEVRATPPMMTIDRYPSFPYMGNLNYNGFQVYFNSITESLLARTMGYGGIAPIELQPLVDAPQPWEASY